MNKIEELKKDIDKNSITHGSLPFWSWNDRLDEDELRRQIRIMKKLGMNGFFMHARCGLETEYLSDEWYSCVKACIDEAKKQGMKRGHTMKTDGLADLPEEYCWMIRLIRRSTLNLQSRNRILNVMNFFSAYIFSVEIRSASVSATAVQRNIILYI